MLFISPCFLLIKYLFFNIPKPLSSTETYEVLLTNWMSAGNKMQGTKVIRIYQEGLKKLDKINSERPQDMSRADTFEHILYVYEEQKLKPEHERGIIPVTLRAKIIDAEAAQKEKSLAPTRNNEFKQIGEVKKP